jgi:hypothetical protein
VSPKPWPYNPEREVTEHHEMLRNTYGDTFISRRAYSAADFLLAEGRNTCDSTNARLVVITIPDILELTHAGIEKLRALSGTADFDPDMPHTRIGAACAELGIPFVNAKEFLTASHYNVGDRHWNPKGHREIAGLLRRLRDSYGVSLPVSESETVPVLRTLAVGRGFGASE